MIALAAPSSHVRLKRLYERSRCGGNVRATLVAELRKTDSDADCRKTSLRARNRRLLIEFESEDTSTPAQNELCGWGHFGSPAAER